MNERMKKIKFVVNPISGTQSKELILNLLDEKIDKARYSWEVVYTERAGHAVEIAAKAAEEKADIVVAIGGDGTIRFGNHSLWLGQWTCTAPAYTHGTEESIGSA